MLIETVATEGACPSCGVLAARVQARPTQHVKDVACGSARLDVVVRKRRYACAETLCARRSFTEETDQLPAQARFTTRLAEQVISTRRAEPRAVSRVADEAALAWPTMVRMLTTTLDLDTGVDRLLGLVEHATDHGWPVENACAVPGLDVRRARRWTPRRDSDVGLVDARPGASVNALTRPRSRQSCPRSRPTARRTSPAASWLAHGGSYENQFWAAPFTVRRVLNDQHLRFRHPTRPSPSKRRPFSDWASYTPSSIWIFDT